MTPQDHYRAAEMLLDRLGDAEDLTGHAAMLAEAQVHATLACAPTELEPLPIGMLVEVGPDSDGDQPWWCELCERMRYDGVAASVDHCRRSHPDALRRVYVRREIAS